MCRFDTLEQKVGKLIDRSIDFGHTNLCQETLKKQIIILTSFIQYFQDEKVYITEHTAGWIANPKPNNTTPPYLFTSVITHHFENIGDLINYFNELLANETEIFIYSLKYDVNVEPTNTESTYKIVVRYTHIDLRFWVTPLEINNKPTLKITHKIPKHKF